MKIKTMLGPLKNDISVWGDTLSDKEYNTITSHISNASHFPEMKPVGVVTRTLEEDITVPAGGGKSFTKKKLILHRNNAGAVIIEGTFPDAMADLKVLKTALIGKVVGGFAITDVAVASNTQQIV